MLLYSIEGARAAVIFDLVSSLYYRTCRGFCCNYCLLSELKVRNIDLEAIRFTYRLSFIIFLTPLPVVCRAAVFSWLE